MMDIKAIDFARLLGFATVSDAISEGLDFQNEAVGARLGAKVGAIEEGVPPSSSRRLTSGDDDYEHRPAPETRGPEDPNHARGKED